MGRWILFLWGIFFGQALCNTTSLIQNPATTSWVLSSQECTNPLEVTSLSVFLGFNREIGGGFSLFWPPKNNWLLSRTTTSRGLRTLNCELCSQVRVFLESSCHMLCSCIFKASLVRTGRDRLNKQSEHFSLTWALCVYRGTCTRRCPVAVTWTATHKAIDTQLHEQFEIFVGFVIICYSHSSRILKKNGLCATWAFWLPELRKLHQLEIWQQD